MACYMVGYDLNKSGQDYTKLTDKLKTFYITSWHYLDSTWLIVSKKSAVEIRDELKVLIDSNDELLVARLTGEAAWVGFSDEASRWLKENLDK